MDIPKKIKELIVEEVKTSMSDGYNAFPLSSNALSIFAKTVADDLINEKRIIYGKEIIFFPMSNSFIPVKKDSLCVNIKENEPGRLEVNMSGDIIDFINLLE